RCNHIGSRIRKCIHISPFSYYAESTVTSLNHIGVLKAWPISLDLLMSIEEFLLAARLYFETDSVECGHRGLPRMVDIQSVAHEDPNDVPAPRVKSGHCATLSAR